MVICADLFYPQFARLAAVSGADILLAPANTGVDLDFLTQRARKNDIALIVSNGYGRGDRETRRMSSARIVRHSFALDR
ncbi:hypothetical protein ACG873_03985 [Mesorhizobium sp. AaZ16]|uniref:hypothetical protein n=1 Tax=Mesorhizobium sp. AaZ16 TaxID=3402289 RepID=UPI00374E9265